MVLDQLSHLGLNVVVAWVVVVQTPRALQTSSTILPSSSVAAVLWPEFWPELWPEVWPEFWPEVWLKSRSGAAVVVVVLPGNTEGHRAAPE